MEFTSEYPQFEVSQWQKDEILKRIEKYKSAPELLIDEGAFFKMLNEE